MNRRTALLSSLFLGGLLPASLLGPGAGHPPVANRDQSRRPDGRRRRRRAGAAIPPRTQGESGFEIKLQMAHRPLHQHPDQRPGPPGEGHHRLDLPPHRHRRMARRPHGHPLRQPARVVAYNSPEVIKQRRRDRRALHQRPPTTR